MILFNTFQKTAKQYPDNIALVHHDRKLTYKECLSLIDKLCLLLEDSQNYSATICLPKNEYAILWQLALNKSQNVFTSVDALTPPERLFDIINQNQSKWLITAPDFDISLLNGFNIAFSCPQFILWNTLHSARYKDVTHIYFSSGSTGKPKGIYLNDAPVPEVVLAQAEQLNIKPDSQFAWLLSPSFDASLSDIYLTLFSGATLHICDFAQNKVKTLRDYFFVNGITHSDISPSVLPLLNINDFPSLKGVIFGGEVGNELVIKEWSEHIKMFNAYGPTETTICLSFKAVDDNWTSDNIGQPLPGVEYIINEDGELHIGGSHVCIGYNQESLNLAKFYEKDGQRLYKTGDLVKRVGDDYFFLGRKDRQFKHNGVLISPEEIEKTALKHGCKEALCKKEDKFILYYTGDLTASELRANLSLSLNKNMLPVVIQAVKELPKNINGKVKI